ncbi:hypothetical protein [Caloramator sp. Dgby_cultured_2]|uniref:hypothetical protein n=1 Tax=Caloramator sp. Dgby_cultured_2 TaxID=3029174 RepID=UPI00237D7D4D|nr:hypothetical protein [Caloramator sp. Dgby_cultured_2]WDU83961.1 hypothetical protein PWK10_05720 [Caloramator sp. Dgby_cultured_2]
MYQFFLKYEKNAYEYSDLIIAVDTKIKNYINDELDNKNSDKIIILKNAINDEIFKYDEKENIKYFNENIILIPRRLVPKNGVIFAVKAANELVKKVLKTLKCILLEMELKNKI